MCRGKDCSEMSKNDDFMAKNEDIERKYPIKRQKRTPVFVK
jgi:hypothetical protein